MSLGSDYLADNAYEIEFGRTYADTHADLSELTDQELITKAIKIGGVLDEYEHFPAYSVAMQVKQNGMTIKQREAMRNCLAYYLTTMRM